MRIHHASHTHQRIHSIIVCLIQVHTAPRTATCQHRDSLKGSCLAAHAQPADGTLSVGLLPAGMKAQIYKFTGKPYSAQQHEDQQGKGKLADV